MTPKNKLLKADAERAQAALNATVQRRAAVDPADTAAVAAADEAVRKATLAETAARYAYEDSLLHPRRR